MSIKFYLASLTLPLISFNALAYDGYNNNLFIYNPDTGVCENNLGEQGLNKINPAILFTYDEDSNIRLLAIKMQNALILEILS